MTDNHNFNPAGNPQIVSTSEPEIAPPASDVKAKQDSSHTEADFMRDLAKATRQKPKSS